MGQVTLEINGRRFEVACDDGQETRVLALGEDIDRRVRDLTESVGQVGEMRLLLMATLLIADELHEATAAGTTASGGNGAGDDGAGEDENLSRGLENVARRLERIAEQLEGS